MAGTEWSPIQNALESVPCLLCRSSDGAPWATENGYTVIRCDDCGLIYLSPRPPLESISEAARTGTHPTDAGELEVTGRYRAVRVFLRRRLIRTLWPDLARSDHPIRWLDIGAGHGELLVALRAELPSGSAVEGVEPNDAKAGPLRERGFRVTRSLDEVDSTFDVVSLMNVYGHLPDPAEFLRSLARVLEPNGEVIIETGNAAELASRSDYPDRMSLPDHLSFAGEAQLRRFAVEAGFEVVSVHRRRVDGFAHATQQVLRRIRREQARIVLPYGSSFRFLYLRCRRVRPG